jgi:lipopolysaccharide transport system ATP-binding protein
VAFAEVEKFLDTPVKRYSSGMYVRLAFAVAAHLQPDILVLDEVLAVGDAEFQKKCFGKMGEVAKSGRTVLFVSHNMSAVLAFCTQGLGLMQGSVAARGPIADVTQWYLQASASDDTARTYTSDRVGDRPSFRRIHVVNPTLSFGETLRLEIDLVAAERALAAIEIEVHDARGVPLGYVSTAPMYNLMLTATPEGARHQLRLGPLPLAAGDYSLHFWLIRPWAEFYDIVKTPLSFSVDHSDPGASGFEFRQSYGRGPMTVPLACDSPAV